MAIMPGALYKPLPSKGRGKRTKGRGICLHVAASEATSLFGFFSTSTSDSHFYVRRDGTIEQYVDTDLVAYANMAGNATLISVETQGGLTNADGDPWTPQQVAALGRLCAWAASIDGFPLQPMPDSKATSRGVGYHRLGVKPWVVAGGQLWSSATGKVCPGAAKIAQIPAVIAAAKSGSPSTSAPEGFLMALTDQQQADLYKRVTDLSAGFDWWFVPDVGGGPNSKGEDTKRIRGTSSDVAALRTDVAALRATVDALVKVVSGQAGTDAASIKAAVTEGVTAALKSSTVNVDVNVAGKTV